ncbi:MAG: DUF4878 domain-containing protein [Paludibacteraceae bacterium]|nr:DUF4878 domain-containing protein [Paludibacteraceae bacterium]
MRKIFILVTMTLSLLSCCESPSAVFEKFSKAVAYGKVEEAKKYCTESTGQLLDLASKFGGIKVNPDYKIVILRDSVVGNKAYLYYIENESSREESVTLYKIDGEWKVNIESEK